MKKGFTLIEFLAVIVVLAIIFSITVPIVLNLVSDSKDNLRKEQIDAIENSASMWGASNLLVVDGKVYYNGSEINFLSISFLQDVSALDNRDLRKLDIDLNSGVCVSYNAYQIIYNYVSSSDEC